MMDKKKNHYHLNDNGCPCKIRKEHPIRYVCEDKIPFYGTGKKMSFLCPNWEYENCISYWKLRKPGVYAEYVGQLQNLAEHEWESEL